MNKQPSAYLPEECYKYWVVWQAVCRAPIDAPYRVMLIQRCASNRASSDSRGAQRQEKSEVVGRMGFIRELKTYAGIPATGSILLFDHKMLPAYFRNDLSGRPSIALGVMARTMASATLSGVVKPTYQGILSRLEASLMRASSQSILCWPNTRAFENKLDPGEKRPAAL